MFHSFNFDLKMWVHNLFLHQKSVYVMGFIFCDVLLLILTVCESVALNGTATKKVLLGAFVV